MWSPSETARRAVLWNARLAISSGMRRVVKDMPRATERRLPEEKLKALRTSLPTAFDLIGDALSGYWVSAEQGSAALLAASRAINALASDVLSDPESGALSAQWREDLFALQGYVSEAAEMFC